MGACCCKQSERKHSDPNDNANDTTKFSAVSNQNKSDDEDLSPIEEEEPLEEGMEALNNSINTINETMANVEAHIALTTQSIELLNLTILHTKSGESHRMPMMNSLTISQMKQLIAKHIGIPEPRQQLKFNEVHLENNQTIAHYHIRNDDTIMLYVRADSDVWRVNVDYKSGTIQKTIYCEPSIKLFDFRKEVQGKIPNVPLADQLFYFNDVQLTDDEKTLLDYGITNKSTLRFEWKSAY